MNVALQSRMLDAAASASLWDAKADRLAADHADFRSRIDAALNTAVEYQVRSASGRVVCSFDCIESAAADLSARHAKGIDARLFRVETRAVEIGRLLS